MIRLNTVLNGSYSTRMVLTSGMLQVTAGLYPGASNRVHSCKVYRKHQGSGLKKHLEVELPFKGTYQGAWE